MPCDFMYVQIDNIVIDFEAERKRLSPFFGARRELFIPRTEPEASQPSLG